MLNNMYAIYDSKAEYYTQPFLFRNDQEAIRQFTSEAQNPESKLNKHAEDYTLFLLGEYDQDTAQFSIRETPKAILRFHELMPKTPDQPQVA